MLSSMNFSTFIIINSVFERRQTKALLAAKRSPVRSGSQMCLSVPWVFQTFHKSVSGN